MLSRVKGDWTNRDPAITIAWAAFGRGRSYALCGYQLERVYRAIILHKSF